MTSGGMGAVEDRLKNSLNSHFVFFMAAPFSSFSHVAWGKSGTSDKERKGASSVSSLSYGSGKGLFFFLPPGVTFHLQDRNMRAPVLKLKLVKKMGGTKKVPNF